MKRRHNAAITLVLLTVAMAARSQEHIPQERGLSVRAEVVEQTYCNIDDEAFSVRMRVRLHFHNISERAIILARSLESPPIVRVAKTETDAQHQQFESDPIVDYFPQELPPAPSFGEAPDSEYFAILEPNEEYAGEVVTGIFGVYDSQKAKPGNGLVPKGKDVLQLGLNTWPYQWPWFESPVTGEQLAKRWGKRGHLATQFVLTGLTPFEIPDKFDNPDCPVPESLRDKK